MLRHRVAIPALLALIAAVPTAAGAQDAGTAAAWSDLKDSFPTVAATPPSGTPADVLDEGEHVTAYLADNVARVSGPSGRRVLVSTRPLRTVSDAGASRSVDVTLNPSGPGTQPRNAPFDLQIADAPAGGFTLGPDERHQVRISPTDADPAAGNVLANGQLFAADTQQSTDTLQRATVSGLETFQQLRSGDAPERFVFHVDLGPGQQLVVRAGVVIVEQDGQPLVTVSAPLALDADQHPVPIDLSADGDRITMTVHHRGAGFAYPILADPEWTSAYDWSRRAGVGTEGWFIDSASDTDYYAPLALTEPVAPSGRDGAGFSNVVGLFITPRGGKVFPVDKRASLVWGAPGTTTIESAQFKDVDEVNDSERQVSRLTLAGGAGPAVNDDYSTADSIGFERPLVTLTSPAGAKYAAVQMFTPGCSVAETSAGTCPRFVANPSHSLVKVGAVDLTLSDDDSPTASASGPLRAASDTWTQGASTLSVDLAFADGGAGVASWAFGSTDSGGSHSILSNSSLCDADHNTHAPVPQGSNICPTAPTKPDVVVDVPALPEGQNRFAATAADVVGHTTADAGTSDVWSIYVDRTRPTIAATGPLHDADDAWVDPDDVSLKTHLAASDARSGVQDDDLTVTDEHGAQVAHSAGNACASPGPVAAPCPNSYANDITLDPDTIPEGDLTFTAQASDHVGLSADPSTWMVHFDRTPPVARANGNLVALQEQWTSRTGDITVGVDGRDARSGVTKVDLVAVNADGRHVAAATDTCATADKDPQDDSCPHLAHETFTIDAGDLPDGRNHFEVQAHDLAGHVSRQTDDWDTYIDHTAPPKPGGVTIATNDADAASITWNPVVDVPEGAEGVSYEYLVLAEGVPITQWTSTPYPRAIVPGVPPGVNLSVLVHAIDQAHNSSVNGEGKLDASVRLLAPRDAADLDGGVTHFAWSAPAAAHGYDVVVDDTPLRHAVKSGEVDIDLGDLPAGLHTWTIRKVSAGATARSAAIRAAAARTIRSSFSIRESARAVLPAPTTAAAQKTIARAVRPKLLFDSDEQWRPLEIYGFLQEPGIQVCQSKKVVPFTGGGPIALPPKCLPSQPKGLYNGMTEHSDKTNTFYGPPRVHIPGSYRSPYLGSCPHPADVLDCDAGARSAIYYNVAQPTDSHLVYVDWWWYLRNNPPLLSIDHHSGDWEGTSVGYDPALKRIAYVGMSQHAHTFRYKRGVMEVDGLRTRIYVAKDSHASYPKACGGSCWQDEKNTPGLLDKAAALSVPLFALLQAHKQNGLLPEHRIDGQAEWGRDSDGACFTGGASDCIKPIPREGDEKGVTRRPQAAAEDRWSSWTGTWGEVIDHAPLTGPPDSPGNQDRFKHPWGAAMSDRYARAHVRQVVDASAEVNDAGTCDDYAGPMVVALACDQAALTRSGLLGEQALDGSASLTGDASGLRAGDGPGIAQAVATSPLEPGQSVTLSGTMPATTVLKLAVDSAHGAVIVAVDDIGLQGGGEVTATASADVPGAVTVTTPAGSRSIGTRVGPRPRLERVRTQSRRIEVTVYVPTGVTARLAALDGAGHRHRTITVHGHGRARLRVYDPRHRMRSVRLTVPGLTTLAAVPRWHRR